MDDKFLKPYNPQDCEENIYKQWEDSGYFNPDVCVEKGVTDEKAEPFTITLPPPNVTGVLHLGHAYEDTLQDAFIRFARMSGKRTLWVPGTDSAAIATQSRVEKNIQKEEKKNRYDLGREELVRRVQKFALDHEHIIVNQIKKMGASLDWSRYAYTLDEQRYHAVMTAFKNMYDVGLIYRGNRIVNWDPKGQTTISDDEIVYEERKAQLYTFRYSKDFPISISTTRPETKVGDTAVAVHPDDSRYKKYVGKEYEAVFCDVPIKIKIIADKHVDPEFGTGALGVTPAHSMVDWEMGEKHALEVKQVINEYARMTVEGRLKDKKILEAREMIVEWLKEEGLLEKEEEIDQNVSTAERTGAIIEPLPKLQWFVAVDKKFTIKHSEIKGIKDGAEITLKEMMRAVVEHGSVKMPQSNFKKVYFHWIDNLHDWCISRQIWFGHRIPVWYCHKCNNFESTGKAVEDFEKEAYLSLQRNRDAKPIVSVKIPNECPHCGTKNGAFLQDPDVLDTWFSSALWTFSTLGWPEKTSDLTTFHPNTFMSPAYEILPLWVSRMILMSGFHLGQAPFDTVLIHGLVRDEKGRKFSKSLGNGVDPLDMIQKYGADALRMGLLIGTAIGNDISFDQNKVNGYKKFANKLWNVARFILENYDKTETSDPITPGPADLAPEDLELLKEHEELAQEVTKDITNFRLYLAGEKLYHYTWHRLADQIIEESKPLLFGDDPKRAMQREATLYALLRETLKLLHPFMPFITEEVWQALPQKDAEFVMIAKWPTK